MPKTSYTIKQTQGGSQTITLNTETIIAQVDGVSTDRADAFVNLEGAAQMTFGTGVTGAILRVRRGTTLAGATVGQAVSQTIAASSVDDLEVQLQDTPGEVAGQSYILTIQQVGATGNGTLNQGSLSATY